ncbi:MAG: tRNA guanosine(34) transglycosylase Tgt [Phycisphaeraceae bacterium]|nr:tRNA guanosine(34) transglycosylase Tgt [Phycisphaeraceae bacterium]
MTAIRYELKHQDATTAARLGVVHTPHGSFDTPAFMPVGTQATVKGMFPDMVAAIGAQIILGNTYHLMLRPGSDLVSRMGGLHHWMRWNKPILTDSGGFQVFSLSDTARIDDDGVTFKSHLDGSTVVLTPRRSMEVQNQLGADIIMAFDDCPPAPSGGAGDDDDSTSLTRHAIDPRDYPRRVREACERSLRWLGLCKTHHQRPGEQGLFGIVQGGTDLELRSWCAKRAVDHDLPGYAIGGVAVGEGFGEIQKVVRHTAPLLPADRPRYLMGVGYERDILMAVQAGVDMFDCVLPTRNARNANAFTPTGQIRLRNAQFAEDCTPIDPGCDCPACGGGFSRSYLRHLFQAQEMMGPILVTAHNLRHFQRYLLDIRRAIAQNDWSLIAQRWPAALSGG